MDTTCTQNIASDTELNQSLIDNAEQSAEVKSQGMALGKTTAQTFADQTLNVATSVAQSYSQVSTSTVNTENVINCGDSAEISNTIITQETKAQIDSDTYQDVVTNVSASQSIDNTISQSAKAEHKGLLVALIDALALVLMVLGTVAIIFLLGGMQVFESPILITALFAFITGLFVWFYFEQWWPYKNTDDGNDEDAIHRNTTILEWALGIGGSLTLLSGIWAYYTIKTQGSSKNKE